MAAQKVYQIQINGLTESVKAVDALNESLKTLEARIKALEGKSVSVGSKSSGGGSSKASSLSEEAKLEKQINQLEEKRVAYSKEVYQNYLAAKDVLKETEKDQKQIAASERLAAKTYSNTIAGMKQELADIKAVMQTVDVSDSGQMKQMIDRAKELNDKLKEIEQSYGQFGRNVGNYSSAFEGMQKLSINIGGVTREFNSAREASKTLKNELIGLEAAGSGNTEVAKELRSEYYKLQSAMDDATKSSKAMDEAMDMMQSFTAMASVGQGLKGFFGLDDTEIERSIQRLVSLQNVLNGIETLRKQMETSEGLGKIFSKGGEKIDKMVAGLTGAKIATEGLTMGSRAATVAVRGLSMALKAVGIGLALEAINLLVQGIEWVTGKITTWVKGDADLVDSTDITTAAIDRQNDALQKNIDLINQRASKGFISTEEARIQKEEEYAKALEETNKKLKERESVYRNAGITQQGKSSLYLENTFGDKGVTTLGGFKDEIKSIDDFAKRWDYLSSRVENNLDITNSWKDTADDAKDELVHLSKMVGGDMVNAFYKFSNGTREGVQSLVEYIDKMDILTNGRYTQALKLGIDKGYLDSQFKQAYDIYQRWKGDIENDKIQLQITVEGRIESMLNELDPTRALKQQLEEAKKYAEEFSSTWLPSQSAKYNTYIEGLKKKIANGGKSINSTIKKNYKDRKKVMVDAEKQLTDLRIENMKEGLNKTITQLEEQRRQELAKVKANGVMVEELSKEINAKYDSEILEAKRKWAAEIQQTYADMWERINSITMQNARMTADAEITALENTLMRIQELADRGLNKKYSDYSINTNNISKKAQKQTGIIPNDISEGNDTPELKKQVSEYIKLLEEIDEAEALLKKHEEERAKKGDKLTDLLLDQDNRILNSKINNLNEWLAKEKVTEGELKASFQYQYLTERNYTTSLAKQFSIRMFDREAYYLKVENAARKHSEEVMATEQELLTKEMEFEKKRAEDEMAIRMRSYYEQEQKEIDGLIQDEHYEEEKKKIKDKYEDLQTKSEQVYRDQLKAIQKTYNAECERLEQENQNNIKNIVANAHNNRIQEYRDFISRLQKIQSTTPITDDYGWGVVRTSESRRQYREALEGYKTLAEKIKEEKAKLQQSLDKNEITFDDFQQAQRELNLLQESVSEATNEILNNLKYFLIPGVDNTFGQLMQSINQYIQAGLQAVQTVMQAINDYQDYEFDKQQEALDKENEMIQEKLDKQADILDDHKSKVESIEDELATSRGDRRQHLIDQLNAEMEAERAAAKEKQRLEKEQEKLQAKQDALDKKRKQAEYKRNLLSILVSTAMATANGLATQPFVPVGIAMGALATSLGMVQYALAAKSKPYAKGGQLEGGTVVGNRHRDGGVKVLGGRAEIEGGEFITNRISTQMNAPLLEFINSKKKKIDVSDLLEFYVSSGSVKKSISKVRTKFEDGGYIPTLPTSLDIRDQLQNIVINQDNRPIYVSVVDINNKQEQVRQVQTLAGL